MGLRPTKTNENAGILRCFRISSLARTFKGAIFGHPIFLDFRGSGTRQARDAIHRNPSQRRRIDAQQMTMRLLATLLSRLERQTVVDMTGLKGTYEIAIGVVAGSRKCREDSSRKLIPLI